MLALQEVKFQVGAQHSFFFYQVQWKIIVLFNDPWLKNKMSYLSVNAYIKRKISFFIYFLNVLATMVATSSGNLFWNKIIKFLKLLEFYVTVRSSLLLSNLYLLHSVIFTAVLRMKIPCYDRIVLRKYEMFRRELSFLFSYSP